MTIKDAVKDVLRGLAWWRTRGQKFFVRQVHYSADPNRNAEWAERERRKYTSQGVWDREQEIIHLAGGGERIFAEVFRKHLDKILIDPVETGFKPSPSWKRIGGFDHGKRNPTAALSGVIDNDGVLYVLAEYYQPDLSPKQHAPFLKALNGFCQGDAWADPTIFHDNQAQSDGDFKAIVDLYIQEGITNLAKALGTKEGTGMERILQHWVDLDHREPTLKIVCPRWMREIDRPVYGLHNDGCPNLVWELKRTRTEVLSAGQLASQNPSEKIVDKDNHLRDCLKYMVYALFDPPPKPVLQRAQESVDKMGIAKDDLNSRIVWLNNEVIKEKEKDSPPYIPYCRRGRFLLAKREAMLKEREQERKEIERLRLMGYRV